ncbi:autotransporter domain-containing protein [Pseudomonas sp. SWI6]|uniref:Autotransporter outer membrane beta-barrel domain-containing protein n=1 Tax=Pseudomonas taiwanensis TaxID=470150 RepID=A0ABR6V3T2_9PSED|nr:MULTISPECIES: autotransporter outer membrane beta-barrel domain-containing protein [Pseudomonas]AGZ34787.1 outer membrane autotransporter [Pseudomonas sp. VLB120]AVD83707.1 autotransporter domain-containing protein [Pseudomonas sp. SWI6]AVD85858.1 autotransporter domain-containing protein [Pseudomonas sp. SWI44]MBC3475071.1 autotransporter outer membrane beta-barrel domain-containing protein [Pseudomonas taiwanensis]MBC3490317.1 autotransporter outer membrane beta-barrel domain-containing p
MKRTSNPWRFDSIFCAVSTSLLLATPVETLAFELQDDPTFDRFLQQPSMPQLSLDPVSAVGLTLGTLNEFSDRMSERHGQAAPDLVASQWSQFFPSVQRQGAQPPDQLEAPSQQLMIGPDLFVRESSAGNVHRAGIFVGHNNLQSTFNGMRPLLGDKQRNAVNLSGESLGVYWSMTHDRGWHLDAVAMGSRIDVNGRGESGQRLDDSGHAMTFSVEGGYPIKLGGGWVIEPQAQLINQQFFPGSQVQEETLQAFDSQPSWSGRVGAKLSGRYAVRGMPIEPYVRTNVWYDFSNADSVKLDQVDKISSSRYSTTVELGLGLVARVTPSVALFVSADYSSDVDGNDLNGLIGSLGVKMRW